MKTKQKTQTFLERRHANGQKEYGKNVQHNESPGKFRSKPQ